MRNTGRDVTGGQQVWGSLIPGFGFANYILGIFSVPIETFLRRDFGERYYTRANFLGGLIIMVIFNIMRGFLNAINPMTWFGNQVPTESWMWPIIKWYVVFGIVHFITIWVRDISGTSKHSFDSGRSWFNFIGKAILKVMNFVLKLFVSVIASLLPAKAKQKALDAFPIFRDSAVFTERFIEPGIIFFAVIVTGGFGQTAVAFWLMLSFVALNSANAMRHAADRAYALDIRDRLIDARAWQEMMNEGKTKESPRIERTVNETLVEIDRNPDAMGTIQEENPTLAKAIEAIRAKREKRTFVEEDNT